MFSKKVKKSLLGFFLLICLGMGSTTVHANFLVDKGPLASGSEIESVSSEGYDAENDPLEPFNRSIYWFNQTLDGVLLRPVTIIYRMVVPTPVQGHIHNFLLNLASPVIFVNDCFQLEGERAKNTFLRFIINTTIGIGGLFDAASLFFDIDYHHEDFGQSLAKAGVPSGPYLVLPLIGPSNPRDFLGRIVDYFFDPVNYVLFFSDSMRGLGYKRFTAEVVNARSQAFDLIDNIESSQTPYEKYRSFYTQNRNFEIGNGVQEMESPTPDDE